MIPDVIKRGQRGRDRNRPQRSMSTVNLDSHSYAFYISWEHPNLPRRGTNLPRGDNSQVIAKSILGHVVLIQRGTHRRPMGMWKQRHGGWTRQPLRGSVVCRPVEHDFSV